MISPGGKRPDPSWRLALLLSLLLHGGVGLALALVPGPAPVAGPAGYPTLDVCQIQGDQPDGGGSTYFLYRSPEGGGQKAVSRRKSFADPAEEAEANATQSPITAELLPAAEPGPGVDPAPATSGNAVSSPSPGPGNGPGEGGDNGPRTGKGGGTSFFQIETKAQRVVYVIDRSSSMGKQGALDRARRELLASLQGLPTDACFQIIVYNSTAHPLLPAQPGWLPASEENRRLTAAALEQLEPEGGTRHQAALPLALALLPDVIFFLTDADDLTLAYVREITRLNRNHVPLHTIELNPVRPDDPDMPLQMLARENHGIYRAVNLSTQR